MKELAIFGSTGSIGCSTLNVVRRERDRFAVSILTAGHKLPRLTAQIREFTPRHVYILEKQDAEALPQQFPGQCQVLFCCSQLFGFHILCP